MKRSQLCLCTFLLVALVFTNCSAKGGAVGVSGASDGDENISSSENEDANSDGAFVDDQGSIESNDDVANDAAASNNEMSNADGSSTSTGEGVDDGNPDTGIGGGNPPVATDQVVKVSSGASFGCSLWTQGEVYCWGRSQYGVLGDYSAVDSVDPVQMNFPTSEEMLDISAGVYHVCAADASGAVWCWGRNHYGQIGTGDNVDVSGFVNVPGFGTALPAVAVASGNTFSCALIDDGSIRCWGSNIAGEMGNGTTATNQFTPGSVLGIDAANPAVEVEAGANFACARLANGEIKCWGSNASRQLGIGSTDLNKSTPQSVPGFDAIDPAQDIALGAYASHACAVDSEGGVLCWGDNYFGQLGDATNLKASLPVSVTGIDGAHPAIAVAVGGFGSCAVMTDGNVQCWGENLYGSTGSGSSYYSTNVPVVVDGLVDSDFIDVGETGQACSLNPDGIGKCWGVNFHGELGSGLAASSFTPLSLNGLTADTAFPRLALGNKHSCVITAADEMQCWGQNDQGQLGDASLLDSDVPVTVSGINGAEVDKMALGEWHTCVLLVNNQVKCWGAGWDGRLGDGLNTTSYVPVTVTGTGAINLTDITAGFGHTCVLRANGLVYCWGENGSGQLGNGTTVDQTVPVQVSNITTANPAIMIEAGRDHTCAVLADGTAMCWGENLSARLGNGTITDSSVPVVVSNLTPVDGASQVAAGRDFTCYLKNDGSVVCNGENFQDQLGDFAAQVANESAFTPQDHGHFSSADPVSKIVSGSDSTHSCALMVSGEIHCWGNDSYGQLGEGSRYQGKSVLTEVAGISSAVAVGVGEYYSCAILSDGTVKCWGFNGDGQIGDAIPVNADSFSPIDVIWD